ESAPVHDLDVEALRFGGRDFLKAWHWFGGQNRQRTHVARLDEARDLGHVAGHRLRETADRLCDRLGAAVKADVLDLGEVGEAGRLQDHQRLEVIETAGRRAAGKGDRGDR